ncbi:methyl-accepting chemotaxis protein [Geobacter sulfurreducens]|jgi:methyl-accepting chemotaxis protein|uniref:Methyl-accepting chemotaxis sensory transducer, class 40H n=1 Tax=Geobacter sulfurreducens (strain ATCC 51573 / DSM 12127 / PCA) TaxID=243231 RepID=Q74ED3_GEOSL|nr:methyl-accepting chemotaxis protein [Geobacter sulfurreducens]AAR34356.1 methyl-accepting chemotaxis sensory transducer, class 40H [Geobacter sulfurreducens PCA]QVW36266.1 methyl-accepting chemotaxis protein [Geobacter sulfurreducens]UAC05078.1 methyl-accepting chemotaxis protein [Geobacter sulfurreducens]UTG93714.1 methyl-accepting chemotaxis protein [Geobacter sulfurreducens]HCD95674.1 methyl-accepting chemotaxis protein [Geobacter sulfurreducens]
MSAWRDLKVRTKIFVLVIAGCLGLVVLGSVALYNMRNLSGSVKEANIGMEHVAGLSGMKSDFLEMRLALVYMLALKDAEKIGGKEQDFLKAADRIKKTLDDLGKQELTDTEKKSLVEFRGGFESYVEKGTRLAELIKDATAKGDEVGRADAMTFATQSVAPLYDTPAKIIASMVQENIGEAHKMYEQDMASYRASFIMMVVIILGVIGVAAAAGLAIAGSISGPLNKVLDVLTRVAAGDLTARADVVSADEMGLLAREVNTTAAKINEIIGLVAHNASQVTAAATQLHATSTQMSTGAEEVAQQAATVATASEEMAATSAEIAHNCSLAAESSRHANDRAENGSDVVQETLTVMNRIAERVKDSARTVESLGERSDQIGEIIGTIQDIADQTNLLALNAAIEAARAGEQGRGFAVVADEVRALAERTTKATKEISQMIKAIQGETKGAVTSMEEGVKEVEKGTSDASKSGEALQAILEQIGGVTMQVSQIATAAEEQTATTGEINNNIQQITEVVQLTARGAEESAQAAEQLAKLAEELQDLVYKFKLA